MHTYDVTILTDHRYVNPKLKDEYIENVLLEDGLLSDALKSLNLSVHRINWDNQEFDWTSTRYIIFRTTWDYFERFGEFSEWLERVCEETKLINAKELIYWNIDKHYLLDIEKMGVRIPESIFIEKGDTRSLQSIVDEQNWTEFVLKPCVSGGAWNTFRFKKEEVEKYTATFEKLIKEESMMLQEFQNQIVTKGEVAFMVFGGKFSHAVLKKAKSGDYRVQDDFGGSLHEYEPNEEEIEFVEKAFKACHPTPVYARVDVLWNNNDELCIGEIELIEPELWFRKDPHSALMCAKAIQEYIS